ncbi:hypothetical protein JOC86_002938 [Bacillus pakistanensis]|uniref:DUF2935 domain-containing protein n=1 Tax=Rossellomorea pakistanensis TaxID=992288 RepID=A0ABS2NEV5_9BACI|nr:hypothetical protein [Bacillus pakistanensis]
MKQTFTTKLKELKGLSSKEQWVQFSNDIVEHVDALKKFKLSLLKRQLTTDIVIHLVPTFLNHMVNELEEYQKVLKYLTGGKLPPIFHELHHHLLWLLDASGHAGSIGSTMDLTERDLRKKSKLFEGEFNDFYLKAVEMAGYLRSNVKSFPALKKFNDDVEIEIRLFQVFLNELEELELNHKNLSAFSPLMADHMYREEAYYLKKVAESSSVNR